MVLKILSLLCLTLSLSVAVNPGKTCEDLHPAMVHQQYGYDETKLSSRGKEGLTLMKPDTAARRNQILQFTCEDGHTFRRNEVRYQVPDGMMADSSPTGSVNTFSICYDDAHKLKEGLIGAIQEWESSPFGSLTRDNSSANFLSDSRCLTSIHFDFSGFQAGFVRRKYQLDADFEKDFNALPENGESNDAAYSEFIGKYGTGYFETGYYGSKIHAYVLTPGPFEDEVDTVKSAIFSYEKEDRNVGISDWIKSAVPEASVLVRTSANGDTWSSEKEDFTGGQMKVYGSYFGILPPGTKTNNLKKAVEEYMKGAGMKKDWRGDWTFPKE